MAELVERVAASMESIDNSVEKNKNFMSDISNAMDHQADTHQGMTNSDSVLSEQTENLNDMITKFKV